MLIAASRQRLVGLALMLLLGAPPAVAADPTGAEPLDAKPTLVPAELKPAGESSAKDEPAPSETPDQAADQSSSETTPDSHRRRAMAELDPERSASSRRAPRGAADLTESPLERLKRHWTGDIEQVAHPCYDRSVTLEQVMRRVAGWGDACPLCGSPHPERRREGPQVVHQEDSAAEARRTFNQIEVDETASERQGGEQLRAGEPAQVILDTQKRLGKSVLDGTEFGGSPELLIQWIRVLDEESRRRQALEEPPRAEAETVDQDLSVTAHSQIDALRQASRQLQEAADLLEEQNLFESADSIRNVAEGLRRQSRQKIGGLPGDAVPAPLTARQ